MKFSLLLFTGLFLVSHKLCAQDNQSQSSVYRSSVDELLTIKKIVVLPTSDNLGGIYARPIEKTIKNIFSKSHHWDLVKDDGIGMIITPNELEINPILSKKLTNNLSADAAIVAQAIKGPNGLTLKVHMYLIKNGRLLAKASAKNSKKFELRDIKKVTIGLVGQILNQIPYEGIVLSRQGERVTLNVGLNDGAKPGQVLSVIQIIKAKYHPKFHFLISTEKEVLGKVKVIKVDKTLSFGKIITEIEKNAIQKNAKVVGLNQVSYNADALSLSNNSTDTLMLRPDHKMSFGKSPKKWLPQKPPTFGSVSAGIGLGSFTSDVRKLSQSFKTSDSLGKNVLFDAELWLTQKITLHAHIAQGIVASNSSANYDFMGGYTYRFGHDVWDSVVEFLIGYASYKVDVNDLSATVTGLTYSGFKMGVSGLFPVSQDRKWALGAKLFMFLSPNLSQSPSSGSASSITANHFAVFGHKKLRENLKAIASLDIELYTAKFSGAAQSSSQKSTILSAGLSYMF